MKRRRVLGHQEVVLKAVANKLDDFYLAGGTALSIFYFRHRMSQDLDFFTADFVYARVKTIIEWLEKTLKKKVRIVGRSLEPNRVRMVVCNVYFSNKDVLKIDFVEDTLPLLKRTKVVEGVKVLSLEDIYIRKLYCIIGIIRINDEIGRVRFIGGRTDAKDFFDLFFLSHTFIPLSKFVSKYCDITIIEGIVRWFRTFNRMDIIDGILRLETAQRIDYKNMERHFAKEINTLLERQLKGI